MPNPLIVATYLIVCRKDIDADLITEKVKRVPVAVTLTGEMVIPSIENGARRDFDPRHNLDHCTFSLSSKQYKFGVAEQMKFWLEILVPVKSGIQELQKLGYWIVIDCGISSINRQLPSIQFRLSKEIQIKLSNLNIDIDFTVFRLLDDDMK